MHYLASFKIVVSKANCAKGLIVVFSGRIHHVHVWSLSTPLSDLSRVPGTLTFIILHGQFCHLVLPSVNSITGDTKISVTSMI